MNGRWGVGGVKKTREFISRGLAVQCERAFGVGCRGFMSPELRMGGGMGGGWECVHRQLNAQCNLFVFDRRLCTVS